MTDQSNFGLFMISAMYENGGNTTHRFLDGHPELYVYPFEIAARQQSVHRLPVLALSLQVPLSGLPDGRLDG